MERILHRRADRLLTSTFPCSSWYNGLRSEPLTVGTIEVWGKQECPSPAHAATFSLVIIMRWAFCPPLIAVVDFVKINPGRLGQGEDERATQREFNKGGKEQGHVNIPAPARREWTWLMVIPGSSLRGRLKLSP
jgi:hypothetical protein